MMVKPSSPHPFQVQQAWTVTDLQSWCGLVIVFLESGNEINATLRRQLLTLRSSVKVLPILLPLDHSDVEFDEERRAWALQFA